MPYSYESPLGAGFTAAAGVLAGQENARRYKQEQAEQAERDRQAAIYQAAMMRNMQSEQEAREFELGQKRRDLAHADVISHFQSQLRFPKAFEKLSPEQQIGYLRARQNAAQQIGDQDTFDRTQKQIDSISLDPGRLAKAGESKAHTALLMAQAEKTRSWRQELQMKFDQANKLQGGKLSAYLQAARLRASAVHGAGNDEKEALALQAALERAEGKSEEQAWKTAQDIYQNNMKQWAKDASAAAQSGSAIPPQPQFNIEAGGTPGVTIIQVPVSMPDGTKKTIPVPVPHTQAATPDQTAGRPPIKDAIAHMRQKGRSNGYIRNALSNAGYPGNEINQNLPAMQGGGFGT